MVESVQYLVSEAKSQLEAVEAAITESPDEVLMVVAESLEGWLVVLTEMNVLMQRRWQ